MIGLPPKTATLDLNITKETKEIAFPIKTELQAPVGIDLILFCQITVVDFGEQVVHNIGATELRIDVPLPPKKDQPAVVAAPPKKDPAPAPNPMAAPPKRLSRLEQLRLEQEEREKAAKQPMSKKEEPKKQ